MNMLSDQRILSFNVNGETIQMALPDAQCDFIKRIIIQTHHFFEAALLSQVAKMGLIKHDTVVCDIGANIGNHSVYFIPVARKAGSLYGFQFRRNLNLCVHLSRRNRWDEL
jgi:hypothetical protein